MLLFNLFHCEFKKKRTEIQDFDINTVCVYAWKPTGRDERVCVGVEVLGINASTIYYHRYWVPVSFLGFEQNEYRVFVLSKKNLNFYQFIHNYLCLDQQIFTLQETP